MYRLYDRHLAPTASQPSSSKSNELSSVIVFKCTNKDSKILVDSIRNANGKPLVTPRRYVINEFIFYWVFSCF